MSTTHAPTRRCARVLGCVLAFCSIGLYGCTDQPEIRTYTAPRSEEAGRPFSCSIPQDWSLAPNNQFSKLAFNCATGAEVTVSSLRGSGPEFQLMNINRWRNQVALPPLDALEDMEPASLANAEGKLVTLTGAEKSVKGAIVEYDNQTWFFKMTGSGPAVTDQTDEFLAFLKSVEFFEKSRS